MLSPPPPLQSARSAYRSYLLAYNSHSMKDAYNVHRLDLAAVAKSFGFTVPPRVNLNMESSAAKHRKAVKGGGQAAKEAKRTSGHGFSADNPYGVRKRGDRRQFAM